MQLLLNLERPGQLEMQRRSSSSLRRASVFEVATAVLGPDRRWSGGARGLSLHLNADAVDAAATRAEILERKRRRSSRRSQRLSIASLQPLVAERRSTGAQASVHGQLWRASESASDLLQRMETHVFVNPALLAPSAADADGTGAPCHRALQALHLTLSAMC